MFLSLYMASIFWAKHLTTSNFINLLVNSIYNLCFLGRLKAPEAHGPQTVGCEVQNEWAKHSTWMWLCEIPQQERYKMHNFWSVQITLVQNTSAWKFPCLLFYLRRRWIWRDVLYELPYMFQFTRLRICFQSGLCVWYFSCNTKQDLKLKFHFVSSMSAVESTFLLL